MRDNNHGSFDLQEINHVPAQTFNEPRSPQARRRVSRTSYQFTLIF